MSEINLYEPEISEWESVQLLWVRNHFICFQWIYMSKKLISMSQKLNFMFQELIFMSQNLININQKLVEISVLN